MTFPRQAEDEPALFYTELWKSRKEGTQCTPIHHLSADGYETSHLILASGVLPVKKVIGLMCSFFVYQLYLSQARKNLKRTKTQQYLISNPS